MIKWFKINKEDVLSSTLDRCQQTSLATAVVLDSGYIILSFDADYGVPDQVSNYQLYTTEQIIAELPTEE